MSNPNYRTARSQMLTPRAATGHQQQQRQSREHSRRDLSRRVRAMLERAR